MSLNRGKLPRDWKCANITPVYKNGGKEYVSNYCPISLTSLVVKTLEKLVTRHIMAHLEDHDLLSPHQYGFRAGFSCTSQLIRLFHSRASALDKNKTSDIVFLDFEKAFDSVPHKHLISKLGRVSGKHYFWRYHRNNNCQPVGRIHSSSPARKSVPNRSSASQNLEWSKEVELNPSFSFHRSFSPSSGEQNPLHTWDA